jgi:hypothetical protein
VRREAPRSSHGALVIPGPATCEPAPTPAPGPPLPTVTTALSVQEAIERLDRASRRGRLPGFARLPDLQGASRFKCAAFGEPFDREVVGVIEAAAGSSIVTLSARLVWKIPAILIGSTVLSIWPGLPIIDKLIPASWGWWETWTWYIPLCVLPLAFLPLSWRKSERAAWASAHKAARAIAAELGASPPAGG